MDKSNFVKSHSDYNKKFSETDIIKMLEFLIYNISIIFGGRVFQQTFGTTMGTYFFSSTYFFIRTRHISYFS